MRRRTRRTLAIEARTHGVSAVTHAPKNRTSRRSGQRVDRTLDKPQTRHDHSERHAASPPLRSRAERAGRANEACAGGRDLPVPGGHVKQPTLRP